MSRPGLHMLAIERAILDRWLAKYDIPGEHVYDLHLVTPDPVWPPHYTEADKEQWRYLTMKRVDLLIRAADRRWILEVTPRVSTRAVGALDLYRTLLAKQEGPDPPIALGIVAEAGDPAVEEVCAARGIRVWLV